MTISNGYASLAQLRQEIGTYTTSDVADDGKMELSIEAASRQIDDHLGFRIWQDTTVVTREFFAESPTLVDLYEQPARGVKAGISTVTGLVVKIDDDGDGTFETTLTISTDFVLLPTNALDDGEPYTEIRLVENYQFPRLSNGRPGVQVTAKFGWPAVPDWAEKACLIQAAQLFKAKDAAFGVATFGEMGGGLRVQAGLNPLAKALVDPHARASVG